MGLVLQEIWSKIKVSKETIAPMDSLMTVGEAVVEIGQNVPDFLRGSESVKL